MELCLGTVQFGMQYGVARGGRPDPAQAQAMLAYAAENGITTIDTASAYGEAEKIVGGFLARSGRDDLQVVTKLRPGILYNVAPRDYRSTIRQSMAESLRALGVRSVYACLFHNAEYADNPAALEALAALKKDGTAQKTGISIYLPQEFAHAMQSPHVDVIQVPYNLLDQRLNGLLKKCTKEIHARSVFLQGLLLMDEQDVPLKLADVKPYLHALDAFCERNHVTRMQTLLSFVRSQTAISKVVFGVDNIEQIRQIRAAFEVQVDPMLLHDFAMEFTLVNEKIIQPNLWNVEYK